MVTTVAETIQRPLQIGPVEVRNRVFVAPHTTNFGDAGVNLITNRHLDYHGARARGGAGLIITEGIRVHPTSLRRLGLHAYNDEALPGLTALAETVHAGGAKLFAQILHTGRHSGDEHAGSWGAAATPWSMGAHVPHVMNDFDLADLVAGFAAAAERVIAAGFDGMEVHLGHGHLLQQFLSPLTNSRDDAYGGDFERRLRLSAEVLAAVSEVVAGRVALGVRLSADEFLPGGLTPDDVVEIVRELHSRTPLDFLHVSHSAYIGAPSLSTQMADMSYERAPFRSLPARFKAEFPGIPVFAICRIDDLATGAEMLEAGEADLVGFARAHIAEPQLTIRSLDASGPRARSCIACNQGCNANLEAVTPITCTVNPAVGREREWADAAAAAPAPRSVLVVGGGPAGLEAATTAARRGHRVVLADRNPTLGGQLLDIVRLDGRPGFATLLAELTEELAGTDVELRLGATLDADAIAALNPDAVVLATGSTVAPSSTLSTPAGPPVLDTMAALDLPAGAPVLIVDELGTWEAYGLALHLAARGSKVEVSTPIASYASRVTVYSRLGLGERLTAAGVVIRTSHRVVVDDDAVSSVPSLGGSPVPHEPAAIVHVRPRTATDDLVAALAQTDWSGDLHLVGDAFAPRSSQEAISEGRGAGLVIGVADDTIRTGIRSRPPYRYSKATA